MDETKAGLDRIFRGLLARNTGPGYGIAILGASSDLASITVELRFIAGRRYCCIEPGCHLPHGIELVIREAAGHGVRLPDGVVVRWYCRVEEGAQAECNRMIGAPPEMPAQDFEFTTPPSWESP